jgi:DNA adenine methylase
MYTIKPTKCLSGGPTRPVLRYHGGKWRLAPWLISFFPRHRVYVEPFGGAASVLIRKPRSYAEVYNDSWSTVVNVFRVLRDPMSASELRAALHLTPYSREEFMAAYPDTADPVENARRTILRSFAGFGSASTNGEHSTGFRATSNRSGTTPAHDWAHYPGQIEAFVARLQGVTIENRSAAEVIVQHDGPETLFYVDPPYPHETRNMRRGNAAYAEEMSADEHRALVASLRAVRGMVVLSGYPCELYDRELVPDWERHHHAHLADGARPRIEVIWLNPACSSALSFARAQLVLDMGRA